jgi:sodium-dependent phosphate cotransporter
VFAVFRLALFIAVLYGFLLSVALMEAGFKTLGTRFAEALMSATANPFAGLMIGLLATSIVQSSSLTTSMMVGMVASGTLSVTHAIPLVMGANIGTTVTNSLVSLTHLTRKDEFERAFAAATVHDFFNLLTAAILLPVEFSTHYLERVATLLSRHLAGVTSGASLGSPLKPLFRPVVEFVTGKMSVFASAPAGILILLIAIVLLFVCLYAMMRLMKGALVGKAEAAVDATIGRAPALGLVVGLVLTAMVQSSSVVTSALVPIAAAGILKLEHVFAITLGANIGTTVTAILAALATGPAGLTLALAHLIFNVTGTLIFFPIPIMREVPISFARALSEKAMQSKWYAVLYVIGVFFILPLTTVVFWKILR